MFLAENADMMMPVSPTWLSKASGVMCIHVIYIMFHDSYIHTNIRYSNISMTKSHGKLG